MLRLKTEISLIYSLRRQTRRVKRAGANQGKDNTVLGVAVVQVFYVGENQPGKQFGFKGLSFLLIITAVILLLVGCAAGPHQLGISPSVWQALSKTQQQQLIDGYQQVKKYNQTQQTVYSGPPLLVAIAQGTAMMPPFVIAQAYVATQFRIQAGQCLHIGLHSVDSVAQVTLRACYNGLVLTLDPSRYEVAKSNGTLRFSFNPLWKRGFTYSNVASSGYIRLHGANVTIKTITTSRSR